ncbi:MAG: basic rane protein [Thermoleophilaceae bacterium]|jgi:basic membrane protein A|nr:basic rane protein [Thermoleophilaceae bacterium]
MRITAAARRHVIVLAAGCALLAAGCGDDEGGGGGGGDAASEGGAKGVKVALVYQGALDDGGWNSSHQAAAEYLKKELPGTEIVEVADVDPGDEARKTFEELAIAGNQLVIGTTFYEEDILAVAQDFPDVKFLNWGGGETAENVGQFSLATEDGRYLDGLVAGNATKSGSIGYVGGYPIEEVVRGVNAFTRGVHEVKPDAKVRTVWVNSWYDPPKERQAAASLADAGVDVLAAETNSPAVQSVAQKRDIGAIGYGWDQSSRSPDVWLTSFTFDWGPYYLEQAKAAADGSWTGEVYYGGLADGVIGLSPFGPSVTPETEQLVEERRQQIADGELDVFAGPIEDNGGKVVVADGATIEPAERSLCCDWLIAGAEGSVK